MLMSLFFACLLPTGSIHQHDHAHAGDFIQVLPTASIGVSASVDRDGPYLGIPGWVGGAMHIAAGSSGAIVMSMGVEVGLMREQRTGSWFGELVPEVRLGGSWIRGRRNHWRDQLLPNFQFYGLAGIRTPNAFRPLAVRMGFGFSWPTIWKSQMNRGDGGFVAVPFMLEAIVDVSSESSLALRIGYHF